MHPVLFRGGAVQAFEDFDKVVDVCVAAAGRHRMDRHGRGIEENQGVPDADIVDIVGNIGACLFLE